MLSTRKAVLYIMLAIGLLAAMYVAHKRGGAESRDRAVELCMDSEEVGEIASASGQTMTEVMARMKSAGATSVAVSSLRFRDAIEHGILRPSGERVYSGNLADIVAIVGYLQMAAPKVGDKVHATAGGGVVEESVLRFDAGVSLPYLLQLPVGLPDEVVQSARKAGLEVIARIPNYPGADPTAIDATVKDLAARGIRKVIFDGDQVLGFRGSEKDVALAFERYGVRYGQVEFSKQKGEAKMAALIPGNTIVVHSITQAEIPNLTAPGIADRFAKAVRERGVRICYVRMLNMGAGDILSPNIDYLSSVGRAITSEGYTLASSHPLDAFEIPRSVRVLVGLGVAAGALLLLSAIVVTPGRSFAGWVAAALVVCVGLSAAGETGRKLVALLAALVFPVLAALYAVQGVRSDVPRGKVIWVAAARMLMAVAISAAGGLLVMGLLSDITFMLRVDTFMGVKVAHLLPVLALAALFAGGICWESAPWADQWSRLTTKVKELADRPVLIWQVAAGAAVLILLALMVARSGNDSGLQVSSIELQLRSVLDKVLVVRPRTKEFLVGYPLLLTGIAFALSGRRDWAAPLVVVGSFGLISALNTFCHIHTPLAVSALRTVNGAVIGALLGMVLWLLIRGLPGNRA